MNVFIVKFLEPFIGDDAKFYSCKSFRAALPSALATFPHIGNDVWWGRWNSDAFERYTRLSHAAKKELFERFAFALRSNYYNLPSSNWVYLQTLCMLTRFGTVNR
jgi:hypothetical protein